MKRNLTQLSKAIFAYAIGKDIYAEFRIQRQQIRSRGIERIMDMSKSYGRQIGYTSIRYSPFILEAGAVAAFSSDSHSGSDLGIVLLQMDFFWRASEAVLTRVRPRASRGYRIPPYVPKLAMANSWRTLGVPETASWTDVKNAYRSLAKKYHPDKCQGDKAKEERFKTLSLAYADLENQYRSANRSDP